MSIDWNLWLGPAVVAALVVGAISLVGFFLNRTTLLAIHTEKLDADRNQALSNQAWADYELRRDAYTEIARWISALYDGGSSAEKPDFHRAARRVRLVGSDEVVRALNAFTAGASGAPGSEPLDQLYRLLFNAMRRDIRELHVLPQTGTDLGPDAFPLES